MPGSTCIRYETLSPSDLREMAVQIKSRQPGPVLGVYSSTATMTPDEAGRVAALEDLAMWKAETAGLRSDCVADIFADMIARLSRLLAEGSPRMKGHCYQVQHAMDMGSPVSAAAVSEYCLRVPDGYQRLDDMYVLCPSVANPANDVGDKYVPLTLAEAV